MSKVDCLVALTLNGLLRTMRLEHVIAFKE